MPLQVEHLEETFVPNLVVFAVETKCHYLKKLFIVCVLHHEEIAPK